MFESVNARVEYFSGLETYAVKVHLLFQTNPQP